jgi:lipoprotein-releasing system ATP-binding protein
MLEAINIHKNYTDGTKFIEVLKGIDLTVEQARFVAITGPSGAGKSTLLHIVGGLDSPGEGSVRFKGEDIYRLSDVQLCKLRNKSIGFVFQFYHLLSEFTVLENVLMPALVSQAPLRGVALDRNLCGKSVVPAWPAGRRSPQLKENAMGLLEATGLSERLDHFPAQLSGGEQQRVAIARALMNSPEMLLCDEPTGNLDSATGEEIMGLIRKISQKNRMTVILVTHNIEIAKSADKVYNLKDGRLIE